MADSSQYFLNTLSDSTLLSSEELTQARAIALVEPDPTRLAETLIKQRWVTRWQARKLLAGKRDFHLGSYKLLDLIGRGGMGAVYRAEHTGLRRQVALKVMSQRYLNNPRIVSRFLEEIRIVSELDHPNIVKAFDADYEQNRYFLVMEYVPGRSLDHWLEKEGRFFVGWACECIRQAAMGLQHAAERNLIHRDVKPSNLIVPEKPAANQPLVKLLDFGLAFSVGETENFGFTQPGRTVGTLDYMAPEQSVSSRNIDARTDIYSLGCVFFHLLTGKLPFPGRNPIERLTRRMKEPAPALQDFRPDLPEELGEILGRMLERNRDRRFRWPIEVAEALAPHAHLKLSMPPMGPPPRRRSRTD